jgi:hypothetical protein
MEGVDPGWKVPPELRGERLPQASVFDELERLKAWAHASTARSWAPAMANEAAFAASGAPVGKE